MSAHDFEVDGIFYNITDATAKTVEVTYKGDSYTSREYSGYVVIPESIAYSGTTYSVTTIGHRAFYDCRGLRSVTIPNSVTTIRGYAFSDCTNLASITIPNNVTTILEGAFFGCTALTSVEIPNNLTTIGSGAFEWTPWYNTWYNNQPDGVVYIGKVLYEYKGTMPANTSLTIEDGTLSITGRAFFGQTSLSSIEIPNSVISIGTWAFAYCDDLKSVTIGCGVTTIGSGAFYDFTGYKEIYSLAETPATIYASTFNEYSSAYNATLYVPIGAKAAYQETEYWKNFTNIVEMDFTDIDKIITDGHLQEATETWYNLNGRCVEHPEKGIYIHNGKKVVL